LDLFQDITIRVLFGPTVHPNELAPFVDAELSKVTAAPVNFSNSFQMWVLCVKSSWKTRIKIGREDRPDQPSKHEISEMVVAGANAIYRLHQIEQHLSPEFVRSKKMFDHKREIFCKPIITLDEPSLAAQPRHPLAVPRSRRVNAPTEFMSDVGRPSDPLNCFGS
jgi:hypothetical protein